jgi:hypothetical protein
MLSFDLPRHQRLIEPSLGSRWNGVEAISNWTEAADASRLTIYALM